MTIGRDGHIQHFHVLKTPDPDLAMSAVDAIKRWAWTPYLLNGQPTAVETTLAVEFNYRASSGRGVDTSPP